MLVMWRSVRSLASEYKIGHFASRTQSSRFRAQRNHNSFTNINELQAGFEHDFLEVMASPFNPTTRFSSTSLCYHELLLDQGIRNLV